jgi:hypothetical protein
MIEGFEKLTESQFETCKKAISWITALIASSDGDINKSETEWAKKITEIRSYSSSESLIPFYTEVGKDFDDILATLIRNLPENQDERINLLSVQLSRLNEIFPLLENKLAYQLYESYKSFGHHVAKSSGGFLGFFSVSSNEKKLMGLPMVNEVILEEDDEEE